MAVPDFPGDDAQDNSRLGVGYIFEAMVRVGLVMALSPALIVVISPLMMFAVIIGLTVWTWRTLFAARERRIRELQSGSPA